VRKLEPNVQVHGHACRDVDADDYRDGRGEYGYNDRYAGRNAVG
jgi:hypothetical protein